MQSVSEERMDHDVHYVCLEMSSEHRSGIFHLWKRRLYIAMILMSR